MMPPFYVASEKATNVVVILDGYGCLPKHPPGACVMVIFLFADDLVLTKLKGDQRGQQHIKVSSSSY